MVVFAAFVTQFFRILSKGRCNNDTNVVKIRTENVSAACLALVSNSSSRFASRLTILVPADGLAQVFP